MRPGLSLAIGIVSLSLACGSSGGLAPPSDGGATSSDAGNPGLGDADAGTADAGSPDAGSPDPGSPDAGSPDAGTPDAGAPDAGAPDAGDPAPGTPDAGGPDAGPPDGGGATAFWLSVTIAGSGSVSSTPAGISCGSVCTASFDRTVTLEATAAAGFRFDGWSGACAGASACVVSGAGTVHALFTAVPPPPVKHRLAVAVSGLGNVTSAPAGISCPGVCSAAFDAGATVQLSATPGNGFGLAGWSGACTGGGACAVAMSTDQSVTATFAPVPADATPISSCGALRGPGRFALTADLSSAQTCLRAANTSGVILDCAGHTVTGSPALEVSSVDAFSFTNCTFAPASQTMMVVSLQQAKNGVFQNDTFGNTWVNAVEISDVRIEQNLFNCSYQQSYSQRVTISGNTFVGRPAPGTNIAALIITAFGSANQIANNNLDGTWQGPASEGTDDGIVLDDESSVVVSGNTIANVFDCGVETSGAVANATISGNIIKGTGFCGIGGWYSNNLRDSTISNNVIQTSGFLFKFQRIFGLRPAGFDSLHRMPADSAVEFHDNLFEGNRIAAGQTGGSTIIPVFSQMEYVTYGNDTGRQPGPSDFLLRNNTFRNNDFGRGGAAPRFGSPVVPGVVIDGGGNICAPGGSGYPLVCH